jgi:hypothetical protein
MLWNKPIRPRQHKRLKYFYFCDKTHPLADVCGIVYYHRHVASEKIGRWVLRDEHVHHIDGDRTNNLPGNLEVMTKQEHVRHHHPKLDDKVCPTCKAVFTPNTKETICCSMSCSSARITAYLDIDYIKTNIWKIPSTHIAEHLGVSDTALCKICKRNGIDKPPAGYWARVRPDGTVAPVKDKSPKWKHGTQVGYWIGACRCDLCTSAFSATEVRISVLGAVHGSHRTYNYLGCRCDTCRAKHVENRKKRANISAPPSKR